MLKTVDKEGIKEISDEEFDENQDMISSIQETIMSGGINIFSDNVEVVIALREAIAPGKFKTWNISVSDLNLTLEDFEDVDLSDEEKVQNRFFERVHDAIE